MGLAALDLGPIQLKNIAEPVRVYSLDVGAPAQAKAAATVAKASDPKHRSMLAPLIAGIVALILVAGGIWYFLARKPNCAI